MSGNSRPLLAPALLGLALALGVPAAQAAGITVDSGADLLAR